MMATLKCAATGLQPEERVQAAMGEGVGGISARGFAGQALACILAAAMVARPEIADTGVWPGHAGL
eukprot:11197061-Lingulodinium_polyedra.AAC.1